MTSTDEVRSQFFLLCTEDCPGRLVSSFRGGKLKPAQGSYDKKEIWWRTKPGANPTLSSGTIMTHEPANFTNASRNPNPKILGKGTYPRAKAGVNFRLYDIVLSILKQRPSAERPKTLRAIQLAAAAPRPLQTSELLCASRTEIPRRDDHGNGVSKHQLIQPSSLQDLMAACKGLLKADTAGRFDFCHEGMRALVSSPGFLRRFQLQNSDEIFAAICIRHLGCGDDTADNVSMPGKRKCSVDGHQPCQLWNYAYAFWHEHYDRLKGASQWIDFLLHKLIIAPFSKDLVVHMECDRRCNRVLATGLQTAAVNNLISLAVMYLDMGAEIDVCNHSTATPLQVAVARSSTAMVELLLDRGADPNAFVYGTLDSPVSCNHMDAALPSCLVKCCSNHKQCHCWRCCGLVRGVAPLHVAALVGNEDMLKVLAKRGANIRSQTKHLGDTPLHLASRAGNTGAVRLLIDLGADVEARNSHGERAIAADTVRQSQPNLELRSSGILHVHRETTSTVGAINHRPQCEDEFSYVTRMKSISLEDGPQGIDASTGRAQVPTFIHRTWDEGSWTFVDGVGVDLLTAGIDS